MIDYDLDRMLFTIPAESHSEDEIERSLKDHREIKFVSFVGIDIGGHDTDEKIPVDLFIKDMDKFLVLETCIFTGNKQPPKLNHKEIDFLKKKKYII